MMKRGLSLVAALSAVPLVSAQGIVEQSLEFVFGATQQSGIFIKVGLFIILFSFLMIGMKRVFPPEHKNAGIIVALLIAIMAMKFMPERWVMGLGKMIWVVALALLPYMILSMFFKDTEGYKKYVFWILLGASYFVMFYFVSQFDTNADLRSFFTFGNESIDDIWYFISSNSWIFYAAVAAIILFLILRWAKKSKKESDYTPEPKPEKPKKEGPGIFSKIWDKLKGAGKASGKAAIGAGKGIGKGMGKAAGGIGKGAGKAAGGIGKGTASGARGIKGWLQRRRLMREQKKKQKEEEKLRAEEQKQEDARKVTRRLGRGLREGAEAAMKEKEEQQKMEELARKRAEESASAKEAEELQKKWEQEQEERRALIRRKKKERAEKLEKEKQEELERKREEEAAERKRIAEKKQASLEKKQAEARERQERKRAKQRQEAARKAAATKKARRKKKEYDKRGPTITISRKR